MKNIKYILLLCFLFSIGMTTYGQADESSYCLLRSKADPDLKPGQCSFRVHLTNGKGPIQKEVIVVDNGVEKHVMPDEKGFITHVTLPGKHALTFVVDDGYYPLMTDVIYAVENYQIIMEVEFKSSVLMTFKK